MRIKRLAQAGLDEAISSAHYATQENEVFYTVSQLLHEPQGKENFNVIMMGTLILVMAHQDFDYRINHGLQRLYPKYLYAEMKSACNITSKETKDWIMGIGEGALVHKSIPFNDAIVKTMLETFPSLRDVISLYPCAIEVDALLDQVIDALQQDNVIAYAYSMDQIQKISRPAFNAASRILEKELAILKEHNPQLINIYEKCQAYHITRHALTSKLPAAAVNNILAFSFFKQPQKESASLLKTVTNNCLVM
jgi:hypothetical protein